MGQKSDEKWSHYGNDDDLTNGARTCIFNRDGVFGIHSCLLSRVSFRPSQGRLPISRSRAGLAQPAQPELERPALATIEGQEVSGGGIVIHDIGILVVRNVV